jgi:uncharacterized membrane protein
MSILGSGVAVNGRRALLLFGLAHVAIFGGLFRGVYSIPFSGTGLYYDYAGKILAGQLPYRDFVAEYPPFALLVFTVPRVLGESFRWYYVWFQVQIVAFDLLVLVALYAAARRWNSPPVRLLTAYSIAILAVGPIVLQQFDLVPAAFMLLAVLAFASGRVAAAGSLLGIGVMTKFYPILIAPLFALLAWRRGRVGDVWRLALACTATCLLLAAPWIMLAPRSLAVLFDYHAQRGIQIESSYATVALAAHALGAARADVVFTFGSWNIAGPFAALLSRLSTIVLILVLALVYAMIDRHVRTNPDSAARDPELLSHAAALILVAALAASKVLSPQYLIWVTPFLPLVTDRRAAIWSIFAVAGVLTYFMYPFHYEALVAREGYAIAIMGIRNGLLVLLAIVLATSLRRSAPST